MPVHEISVLIAYASSEGSDETAHMLRRSHAQSPGGGGGYSDIFIYTLARSIFWGSKF